MKYNVASTSNVGGTIQGINGNNYAVNQISFDPETYLFTYGDAEKDITNDIFSKDKQLLVPDFDLATENYRRASANGDYKPGGMQPLEENTAVILADQLISDPLAAPLDALSSGFDKVIANAGFRKLALLGFLGLAIYFVIKSGD